MEFALAAERPICYPLTAMSTPMTVTTLIHPARAGEGRRAPV